MQGAHIAEISSHVFLGPNSGATVVGSIAAPPSETLTANAFLADTSRNPSQLFGETPPC